MTGERRNNNARRSEWGNVFFTLFGAVALVGVVGAATATLMRGPLGTMVKLRERASAETNLELARQMIANEIGATASNCDADTYLEPLAPDTHTLAAGCDGLVNGNGGCIPSTIGATKTDSWGTKIGYCAWDHGANTCAAAAYPPNSDAANGARVNVGDTSGSAMSKTVIAVISAGADRTFQTTCGDHPAYAAKPAGSDDIIVSWTYSEASTGSDGLWALKSGDPSKITTTKDVEISSDTTFASGSSPTFNDDANFGASTDLSLSSASGFFLPTDTAAPTCTAGINNWTLRINTATGRVQVCDPSSAPAWTDVGAGVAAAAGPNNSVQFNNAGAFDGSADLTWNGTTLAVTGAGTYSTTLGVTGDFAVNTNKFTVAAASGNTLVGGTFNAVGAGDFDSTLLVNGAGDFDTTLNVDGATTLQSTLAVAGNVTVNTNKFTIDATTGNTLVAGTLGVTGNVAVNTNKFNVDAATGNTLVAGTLGVTSTATASQFIASGVGSAAAPAFQVSAGEGLFSEGSDGVSIAAAGARAVLVESDGDVKIGSGAAATKLDVGGAVKIGDTGVISGGACTAFGAINFDATNDELLLCSTGGTWVTIGTSGGGGGGSTPAAGSNREIQFNNAGVFGASSAFKLMSDGDLLLTGTYTGTASVPATGAGTRMFFDTQKAAFRAGEVSGNSWDSGNIGNHSVAIGYNTIASGDGASAIGYSGTASGFYSMAVGYQVTSNGARSIAMGDTTTSSGSRSTATGGQTISAGDYSFTAGREVNVTASGDGSFGFGLTTTSPATDPMISGAQSFGIFMGNQSGVDLQAANTFGLLGGKMIIDQTPAAIPAVSGTLTVDVEGDVGAAQYCDENGANCFTAASVAAGSSVLSSIGAATGTNTIANGDHAQIWNWALTTATKDAFTFGETTAATGGAGDQSILKATTLAASTAIPLMVSNAGNGYSFRVNDDGTDTDATGFMIDNDGNVGIGGVPQPTNHLFVSKVYTASSGWDVGAYAEAELSGAYAGYNGVVGLSGSAYTATTGVGFPEAYGVFGQAETANDAKAQNAFGVAGTFYIAANDAGYALSATDNNTSTGGTAYGVYIDLDDTDLTRWGIYQQSANDNYLAGRLLVGTNTPTTGAAFKVGTTDSIMLPSGTDAQRPGAPAGGMFRYNTTATPKDVIEYYDAESAAWVQVPTSVAGGAVLSGITAATAANTIGSGDFAQAWNWTLTTAAKSAFTFGETAAATNGAGAQSILKASTLAASTAMPLWIVNEGNANSFQVDDVASDTSPVIIDASGKVAIGATTARALLDVNGGDFIVSDTFSGTASVPVTGAGARMFYEAQKAAFRAGTVDGTQWDNANIGDRSVAFGWNNRASGQNSYAMGYNSIASGGGASVISGDTTTASNTNAMAFGRQVISSGVASVVWGLNSASPATRPTVSGNNSFGIFMGNHDGKTLAATNTFGLFGGTMVIDPAVPATQLTARGVIDVGAATTSIVLPTGTDAQRPGTPVGGMFRYNTTATPKDVIEYYDAESAAWVQVPTSAAGAAAIDDLSDAYTIYDAGTTSNFIMGRTAAAALTAGAIQNLFIGERAGATTANSTAATDNNLAIGYNALNALTSGTNNLAIGVNTLSLTLSGSSNVAVGFSVLKSNTGNENTSVGTYASYSNTTGSSNSAFGKEALSGNTTGRYNTAIGYQSMYANKAKEESTAVGYRSMYYADDTTTGSPTYNTALGAYALQGSATAASNTGTGNTAVGHNAMLGITAGLNNTGIGRSALTAITDGDANTALGKNALLTNSTGDGNTALGDSALELATSINNTAVGFQAGNSITTGATNIVIGYGADTSAAGASNELNIGDTIFGNLSTDNVRIGGSGAVGAGPLIANPPATETIAAAATITANACGTVKTVQSTGNVTTNTTNTFSAPTAALAGCCMDVINVDTADTITLDDNANFQTAIGASNIAFGPGQTIRVCSNGTIWYESTTSRASKVRLSDVLAATGNTTITNASWQTVWQAALSGATADSFTFGESSASSGGTGGQSILKTATVAASTATPLIVTNLGAALSFIVNDATDDLDATAFVVDAAGLVGIGTRTPRASLDVVGTDAIVLPSGTDAQRPGTPAGGMFRYNTTATPKDVIEYYDAESAAWVQVPTSVAGGAVLSGITAATAANTIGSGDFAQTWNWTLTTAAKSAFTFGETAAATNGAGAQSVLKASTLAASTAMPLWVVNDGSANSFQVDDVASDTSPFVIKADGQVGVGTNTPIAGSKMNVVNPSGQTLFVVGNTAAIANNASDGVLKLYGEDAGNIYDGSISQNSANMFITLSGASGSLFINPNVIIDDANVGKTLLIGTSSVTAGARFKVNSTDSIMIPAGTTGQRPGTGAAGMIRYNTTTTPNDTLEYYDAETSGWIAVPTSTTVGTVISSLTAAAAINTIDNFNYAQNWQWNSLGAGNGLSLSSTSTAAASNTQTVLNVSTSGANGTPTQTTYGAQFSNTHTGATSTNVGLYATASGGTNNYAAILNGQVGIGTISTPDAYTELHVADTTAGAVSDIVIGNPNVTGNNSSDGQLKLYGESGGAVGVGTIRQGSSNMFIDTGSGGSPSAGTVIFGSNVLMESGKALTFHDSSFTKTVSMNHDGTNFTVTNTSGDINFPSDNVNIGTASGTAGASLKVGSTDSILIASGTEAQRPGTPANGMMRYKTDVGTSAIGFEVREAGAWVAMGAAASDVRLKHDIAKLDSQTVMDRLAQVQGVSYRLKAEGDAGRTHYGVIAQDLERVFPELVNGGNAPDDMKSVRYLEFTGLLIEAAKELKTENDDLKTRLAAIETDVKGMKAHTGYGIGKASFEGNGILFLLIGFGLSAVAFTLGGAVRNKKR